MGDFANSTELNPGVIETPRGTLRSDTYGGNKIGGALNDPRAAFTAVPALRAAVCDDQPASAIKRPLGVGILTVFLPV
jgi:hypothetical protein